MDVTKTLEATYQSYVVALHAEELVANSQRLPEKYPDVFAYLQRLGD